MKDQSQGGGVPLSTCAGDSAPGARAEPGRGEPLCHEIDALRRHSAELSCKLAALTFMLHQIHCRIGRG